MASARPQPKIGPVDNAQKLCLQKAKKGLTEKLASRETKIAVHLQEKGVISAEDVRDVSSKNPDQRMGRLLDIIGNRTSRAFTEFQTFVFSGKEPAYVAADGILRDAYTKARKQFPEDKGNRLDIERLRRVLEEKEQRIIQLEEEREKRITEMNELKQKLLEKDEQVGDLHAQIGKCRQDTDQTDRGIAELRNQIDKMLKAQEQTDKKVGHLQQEMQQHEEQCIKCEEKEQRIIQLEEERKKLIIKINELEQKLIEKVEQVDKMRQGKEQTDKRIAELQNQIGNLKDEILKAHEQTDKKIDQMQEGQLQMQEQMQQQMQKNERMGNMIEDLVHYFRGMGGHEGHGGLSEGLNPVTQECAAPVQKDHSSDEDYSSDDDHSSDESSYFRYGSGRGMQRNNPREPERLGRHPEEDLSISPKPSGGKKAPAKSEKS